MTFGARLFASFALLALAACAAPQGGAGSGGGPGAASKASDDRQFCRSVDDLLLTGQRSSFGLKFADAENAFAELLSIYSLNDVTARCTGRPSEAFVLMNQALAHSSQERFATADGLFARAADLLDEGSSIPPQRLERERALLGSYRAQDLLNRSSSLDPRRFAEAAAANFSEADSGLIGGDFDQMLIGGSPDAKRALIEE
ncbi:MAG: hypothetical protein AAFP78_14875, partial [Pseudomonadota bacterium]